MSSLIKLLSALADLVRFLLNRKEQKEYEKEVSEVREDPTVWFNEHFDNSVHEHDADNAGKAENSSRDDRQ
ncbi:hypothetical protein [Idiomarina piscisalsi]|uniref:Uncharacterized protein n=1 Tax=Idiomarina piscisalsi TaxID=1096243 RepID=A0A432YXC5_9GAMM|nr:hypothetical protein [Idiomarina piscisalsi]RUO67979.1 hypothetical protein CWI73_03745 [Idiomarina piscisalsi]